MFDKEGIVSWLKETDSHKTDALFREAYKTKVETIGEKVYLRGLVEISNVCRKNCLYCGIRRDNAGTGRYELTTEQVLEAARFAHRAGYGSLVIQGGERNDKEFTHKITELLKSIKKMSGSGGGGTLGITLSLGEQSPEVFREWFEAGAHRYLLRIESSSRNLYNKIHPDDQTHSFDVRMQSLYSLKEIGYQVGTGVMIGLPFQDEGHLADDLLFFKKFDIDMCGMGPYLEHSETPLYQYRHLLMPVGERLTLSLKMVALLRLLMPDINIAATTALQVLDPDGREKAIMAGANIIMPNMTISQVRSEYQIYDHKPGIEDDAAISKSKLEENLSKMKIPIGWSEWGDSKHADFRKGD